MVRSVRKAQAAMEYLLTYGWAILIMVVVVAVLYYLGVITPHTPTFCTFENQVFSCKAFKLTSNTGNAGGLILDLAQTTGHDILIVGFNCTTNQTWSETDFTTAGQNVTVPANSDMPLNGTATSMGPLPCYKNDNSLIGASDSGSSYRGKIYIHYWDLETNLDHKVIGDISATVE